MLRLASCAFDSILARAFEGIDALWLRQHFWSHDDLATAQWLGSYLAAMTCIYGRYNSAHVSARSDMRFDLMRDIDVATSER